MSNIKILFIAFLTLSLNGRGLSNTAEEMVAAAHNLLNSLSAEQKVKMTFEVSDTSREIWHYLPVANFSRFGIPLNELNAEQDELVYQLLQKSLSAEGYGKARQIMNLESILKEMENNSARRDPQQYHIAIYGTPSTEDAWSWSLSGHHISLHFTMIDGKIADTPTFLGSNPAEVRQGPQKGLRVLREEEDLGIALVGSLSPDQQKKAIFLTEAPYEIFTAAESEVSPLEELGIDSRDLNESQMAMLKQLVEVYIALMPEDLASARMQTVEDGGWNNINFAWAGTTDRSSGHYYRIQGPGFLIEFDNTQNDANHIHSVWRDFDGDFGRDLIKDHYKASH